MDNTEAIQGGMQIGNAWAAQWARNKQQAIENTRAEKDREDRLLGHFGEAAVIGPSGKVDILASANRLKQIQDQATAEGAQGFVQSFDPNVVGGGPVVPNAPPDMTKFEQAFQQKYGRAPQKVDVQQTAPPVVPDSESRMPAQMPEDFASRSPAWQKGFVTGMPVAQAQQQKSSQQFASDMVKERIAQQRHDQMMEAIRVKERTSDDTNKTRREIQEMKDEAARIQKEADRLNKETIANLNNAAKQKQVETAAANKPLSRSYTVQDRVEITDLQKDITQKERVADALTENIAQLTDVKIDPYVRNQAGLNILNTLNSTEGKNAVGAEEAKRLGQFLSFQANPLKVFETGRLAGRDMPRFVQQITLKRDELLKRVESAKARLNSVTSKYPEAGAATGSQSAAPQSAGKDLDVETARRFLNQAGGDRAAAKKLARDAGYNAP